ncbi:MAG: Holliday junction resolvase RuvX [Candidatus Kerfeldbacteria bacterium]|nr:Holliday junction resolvase RuvX [Candidatus Kerfeldbacteria bacterium]
MGRWLGIDYGAKRVGVALSDESGQHVFPRETINNLGTAKLIVALRELIAAEDVDRMVVGLPLTMRGERGPQAIEVQSAMERIGEALSIPIEYEDERLSSSLADRFSNSKFSRDSLAAAAILESFLSRRRQS